jgi:3-polyprenyl-4-hydroxybenzoate decarboxylase
MATAKKAQPAAAKESRPGPVQDLRDWLDRVEEIGELIRIKEPVDCIEEMSAVGYLVAKQVPSPAILFEQNQGLRE